LLFNLIDIIRTFSQTGFQVELRRRRTPILLQVKILDRRNHILFILSLFKPDNKELLFWKVYLPTGLFVVVSWISFIVPPEVVPGTKSKSIYYFLQGKHSAAIIAIDCL